MCVYMNVKKGSNYNDDNFLVEIDPDFQQIPHFLISNKPIKRKNIIITHTHVL